MKTTRSSLGQFGAGHRRARWDVAALGLVYTAWGALASVREIGNGMAICGMWGMREDGSREADRSAAAELLENILSKDIALERGSAHVHGARIERRIFKALRLARADERLRGFDTAFEMRKIAVACRAQAVEAKHPGARPLHYWLKVNDVRVQAHRYRGCGVFLVSDDARITIEQLRSEHVASVDGEMLIQCGTPIRFPTEVAALQAAVDRMKKKERTGF